MTDRQRRRRKVEEEEEEEDEEDERVLYFVPAQDIEIEVLVYYLRKYLGYDSDAEPGQHPKVASTSLLSQSFRLMIIG